MKTVMILGGSASEVPVIRRALEMGHRVVLVDRDEGSPGFTEDVIAERGSIADVEAVLALARKHGVDGVVASVDAGVRTAARVCAELGLPGISEAAAAMGTDKVAMRRRLAERGVPVPGFRVARDEASYIEAVAGFEGKCVVKAPDSSGSRGIYLLQGARDRDPAEVEYAFSYCMGFSGTGELLVEECMEGPEVCVETLSSEGTCYPLQVTDQMSKEPPYFTDCGYSQPSALEPAVVEQLKRIAIDANMALENYQGSSCTEIMVTEGGPKVVEIGLRLAGDFMATGMVPLSTGVDVPAEVVKVALGEPIDVEPRFGKGSCIRYFMRERVGTIKEVTGLDEAKAVPGVVEVGVLKGVGEEAVPLRKSNDRLGYVMAQMDTPEAAVESAERALSLIDFVVEEKTEVASTNAEACR